MATIGTEETWMKDVYQIPASMADKVKTIEDLKKYGKRLSPEEVEKTRQSYENSLAAALKNHLVYKEKREDFKSW